MCSGVERAARKSTGGRKVLWFDNADNLSVARATSRQSFSPGDRVTVTEVNDAGGGWAQEGYDGIWSCERRTKDGR